MDRLSSIPNRVITSLVVIVLVCSAGVAAYSLATSLPWNENSGRYWDDAALYQGIQNDGFPSGRGVIRGEYAILKFGYALPFWMVHRSLGVDTALAIGLFWFVVMLLSPIVTGLFRRGGFGGLCGWLAWAASMIAIPFVNKYIGMSNPTIQSMGLWLMLCLFYGTRDGKRAGWMVIPGLLCGLLVLTDYKWLIFCVAAVAAIEVVESRDRHSRLGKAIACDWLLILRRLTLTVGWIAALTTVASLLNSAYFDSITYYLTRPGHINAIRPALSWNIAIFLWTLGGAGVVLWTVYRLILRQPKDTVTRESSTAIPRRLLTVAIVIAALASFVFWPRSARMFAPAVVMLFLVFGLQVAHALRELRDGSKQATIQGAILLLVLLGLGWRAKDAGDYYEIPHGVGGVVDYFMSHFDEIPPQQVGCYLPPVFRIYLDRPYEWVFLPTVVPQALDWAVMSDKLDAVVIDEQHLLGNNSDEWKSKALENRERLGREGLVVTQIPNPFYSSAYYLCESYYSDSELWTVLQTKSDGKGATWDIRFIGGIFGRKPPPFVPTAR